MAKEINSAEKRKEAQKRNAENHKAFESVFKSQDAHIRARVSEVEAGAARSDRLAERNGQRAQRAVEASAKAADKDKASNRSSRTGAALKAGVKARTEREKARKSNVAGKQPSKETDPTKQAAKKGSGVSSLLY